MRNTDPTGSQGLRNMRNTDPTVKEQEGRRMELLVGLGLGPQTNYKHGSGGPFFVGPLLPCSYYCECKWKVKTGKAWERGYISRACIEFTVYMGIHEYI